MQEREKIKDTRNTKEIVPMERGGDNRGRSMSGSYTHVCKHPAQNERCGIYGVFERGEHEICVPKSRILV